MPVLSPAEFGEPSNPREEARFLAEVYVRTARSVAALPESFRTRERAARFGIEVADALAEAAARSRPDAPDHREPSAGIEVRVPSEGRAPAAVLAPAFRSPSPGPTEVRADRFFLRVGNHHGETLHTVTLSHFLSDVGRYVTSPMSLTGAAAMGERVSLIAPRDRTVLADVQLAVVPVPVRGRAAIRPLLLSDASAPHAPDGLAIVASRQGTSVAVIENRHEARSYLGSGQAIDFNDGGERKAFAVDPHIVQVVTVVYVPLLSRRIEVRGDGPPAARPAETGAAERSDNATDRAPSTGPFVEGYGERVERDESRPLRATVFVLYPVTDGDLGDGDWESIAGRLRSTSGHPESIGTALLPESDARRSD